MTELHTLDLSYNELTSFSSDEYNFTFPRNLTSLFISNNKLQHLQFELFSNPDSLKMIDLQNNSIEFFDSKLLMKVNDGLNLYIAGMYVCLSYLKLCRYKTIENL